MLARKLFTAENAENAERRGERGYGERKQNGGQAGNSSDLLFGPFLLPSPRSQRSLR